MHMKQKQTRATGLPYFPLKNFDLETLTVVSKKLTPNPLSDPHTRHNPILIPKKLGKNRPLVLYLSGYGGEAYNAFNSKWPSSNVSQKIDFSFSRKKAPNAIYVFVDAGTSLGGSQFINSKGTGNYANYITQELLPLIKKEYKTSDKVCVMGISSGAYGALFLASHYPKLFSHVGALGPDSFFEYSILTEIYTAIPYFSSYKNLKQLKEGLDSREHKGSWSLLNSVAMGLCYSPNSKGVLGVDWPVDLKTGKIKDKVWKKWKAHDPVEFLKKKTLKAKSYLEVGLQDQFFLLYGARQIKSLLKHCSYNEFEGDHFALSSRIPHCLEWLEKEWKTR